MPYDLGIYSVTHKGKTVTVELEKMHVHHAANGDKQLQQRIAMTAKAKLKIGWVEYSDIVITLLKDSDTPSGCQCNCYYCDEMTSHCRNRRNNCHI